MKFSPTRAFVWLVIRVDLDVTLQVMRAYEVFIAVRATEPTIAKVILDMRLDVLFPPKSKSTIFKQTFPLPIIWHGAKDEGGDFIDCDSGVNNALFKVDI